MIFLKIISERKVSYILNIQVIEKISLEYEEKLNNI